jgi:precorrin-2 dehydrogenase/sirohydrochlorin ferrochelatase
VDYYPIFLNLEGRKAVVVGGGRVAERKVLSLIESHAAVTVISPSLTERLRKEKSLKTIRHKSRRFRKGDLEGAFLVIAATDSQETNRSVSREASCLVNVVDVPSECNFIAPSVVKRGPLTFAISTGGISPAMSKSLRKEIGALYGPSFSGYLRFVRKIRTRALAEIVDKKKRESFLKGIASAELLKTLRTKGPDAARKMVLEKFAASR